MIKVLANLPTREHGIPGEASSRPTADYLRERLPASLRERIDLVIVGTPEEARREIVDAEVYFGWLTPDLLERVGKLRWVQNTGASQERHLFPELIASDVVLTNVAGL